MVKRSSILCIIFILSTQLYSQVLTQFRGPNRDGIYPGNNLLQHWPENGPEMLWSYEGLGAGHSSIAIANNKIYTTGMQDSIGILFAFNMNGKLLWQKEYGPEWTTNYPGTRSTPTIAGNYLYIESGQGEVFCFNASNGQKIWSINLLKKFNAKNISWGMTESLLIDGDRVICTPGGPVHNVVALNRFTGETIWTSRGAGEQSAYCSPILVNHNNNRLIVTMTAESIIGINADNGKYLWRVPQYQVNKIHANSPVYWNGQILCSSDYAKDPDHGTVLLQLDESGKNAAVIWRTNEFRNLMGRVILKDGFVLGYGYHKKTWFCVDMKSGYINYAFKGFGYGNIIYADGLFYCYNEKGEVALVDADEKQFNIISSFPVPLGTDQHWAHPVIKDGRLYIRHGNALMVYDIGR